VGITQFCQTIGKLLLNDFYRLRPLGFRIGVRSLV
jgi:hypothetical protein